MSKKTEFASTGRRGVSAFEGLASRTGRPLYEIATLAAENRLGELFDRNGFVGHPLTPGEALRRLERIKDGPPPMSPGFALAELRRRRDPRSLPAERDAQRAGW
ncbi:hypothetical protein BN971_03244 [Mycobacterium bohemicum DSM 44277]|uniref:Uncharacterized protein n=1 Tax=Mycobacterium bohemicum DSM 44277 TaxID=1236609 RepID=A0A0U0W9U7_MYCBE|nr:hypothetical protein [Mycobacterium bohemicum]MCV6968177.1 hypothetical protein [Mycobacterium bohemicum]CPR11951.1 hypothetical protein BN971_03244 [Mycobacterium bohemicum DSM 44277]